jgi:hypothetical protein
MFYAAEGGLRKGFARGIWTSFDPPVTGVPPASAFTESAPIGKREAGPTHTWSGLEYVYPVATRRAGTDTPRGPN